MIEYRAFYKEDGKWKQMGPWRENHADAQADVDAFIAAGGKHMTVIDDRVTDNDA